MRTALSGAIASGVFEKALLGMRLAVDVNSVKEMLDTRIKELDRILNAIEMRDDTPCIKGIDIDAYRVAALAATSVDEALFDYPSLSREQVELAASYTKIYPKSGRPYPSKSFKRAILGDKADELRDLLRQEEQSKIAPRDDE